MSIARWSPLVACALLLRICAAQVYEFDWFAVPESRTLHTLYAFYVYTEEDVPVASEGPAYVEFRDLRFEKCNPLQGEESHTVQVAILPYEEFWDYISSDKFCCEREHVNTGQCAEVDQLLLHVPRSDPETEDDRPDVTQKDVEGLLDQQVSRRLSFERPSLDASVEVVKPTAVSKRLPFHHSGVYMLLVSNCGKDVCGHVKGTVAVKNPYGFLPGCDFPKLHFFRILAALYVCLGLAWVALWHRGRAMLYNIQACVIVVVTISFASAICQHFLFWAWNVQGTRSTALFLATTLLSVIKSASTYVFLLVASLGWGVTRPHLGYVLVRRISIFCVVYIFLDCAREAVLALWRSHSLSFAFVGLVLIPVGALNCGLCFLTFRALWRVIGALREQQQFDRLLLFQRLRCILVLCLGVAVTLLFFQIVDLSQTIAVRWRYEWIWSDGVENMLLLIIHISMVYLWAPNKYSQSEFSPQTVAALLPRDGGEQSRDEGNVLEPEQFHKVEASLEMQEPAIPIRAAPEGAGVEKAIVASSAAANPDPQQLQTDAKESQPDVVQKIPEVPPSIQQHGQTDAEESQEGIGQEMPKVQPSSQQHDVEECKKEIDQESPEVQPSSQQHGETDAEEGKEIVQEMPEVHPSSQQHGETDAEECQEDIDQEMSELPPSIRQHGQADVEECQEDIDQQMPEVQTSSQQHGQTEAEQSQEEVDQEMQEVHPSRQQHGQTDGEEGQE